MHRIDCYFRDRCWNERAIRRQAAEVLDFCEVIIRIHREADDRREESLEGLRDLEQWAIDVLRRTV